MAHRQESLAVGVGPRAGSGWQRSLLRLLQIAKKKQLGTASGLVFLGICFLAVFADVVSPYSPYFQDRIATLEAPSMKHLLGTDDVGRDLLSRIIHGSRISLYVGIVAVGIGITFGTFLGMVSGYFGGKIDMVIQRLIDALMAFPLLVLALAIVAVLGSNTTNVMIAVGIVMIPGASRVVRGAVLSVKQEQYVEAARALGALDGRIMFLHILPNVMAPVLVLATLAMGRAIMWEATLSFLGVGTQPPEPSWGSMLSGYARQYFELAPWNAFFPGVAISLAIMSINLFGDALRDVLDPRQRGAV